MSTITCPQLTGANPRISARRGQVVDLNSDFFKNGVLTDPFAIRHIEIYKTQVIPSNLIAVIPIADPANSLYPAPLCRESNDFIQVGGTELLTAEPGKFHFPYVVPVDVPVPDIYFDLWYYFAEDPCDMLTPDVSGATDITSCDLTDPSLDSLLLKCCHRFWIYPEEWFCDDHLQNINFAFEPLDQRFNTPEVRHLSVGIMPLPLYDFNFNLVMPMMPFLKPTISILTQYNELLVDNDQCEIKLRQGAFRTNPFIISYKLDTSLFLRGTFQYFITLALPDGSTRASRRFVLVIV